MVYDAVIERAAQNAAARQVVAQLSETLLATGRDIRSATSRARL
jgi:hypothetical protein